MDRTGYNHTNGQNWFKIRIKFHIGCQLVIVNSFSYVINDWMSNYLAWRRTSNKKAFLHASIIDAEFNN